MKKIIKCEVCQAEMGSIEKEAVTAEDEALLRQCLTCPNGHSESAELVAEE